MEQGIDSSFFPLVSLVKGNLFRVMHNAGVRGPVLPFKTLLNGSKFSKGRRDIFDEDS